jgi:hypothetical protein
MGTIAAFGSLGMLWGLQAPWVLAVIGAVGLLVMRPALVAAVLRVRRLGFAGPLTPRWWMELAAIDGTLVMACVCFYLVDPARIPPGGWLDRVLMDVLRWMGASFFILATTGYLVGLVRRKRARGPSLEFVNYFYWLTVPVFAATAIANPGLGGWTIPTAGVVVAVAAGVEQVVRRTRGPESLG